MKSGTKGLVVYNGKLILVLRDDKPDIPYPNIWDTPGGGMEDGETFEEAGMREIKEEIGITPKTFYFLGKDKYEGIEAGRFIAFLDKHEFNEIKLGNEGQKYELFTIDEMLKLDFMPKTKIFIESNKKVLKEIIEKGKKVDPGEFVFMDEN